LNDISDYPLCVNPECGHGWEREFLDGEFTRTFRLSAYKEHREKVLSDRERARLPASQEDAIAYKRALAIRKKGFEDVVKLQAEYSKIQEKLREAETSVWRAGTVLASFGQRQFAEDGIHLLGDADGRRERAAPAAFIRPCPAADCKGFLSTAWKCGLCSRRTCADCHELKDAPADSADSAPATAPATAPAAAAHICDPDKAASAALIDRESKGCPKCGVRICKIEGCDQMWCTACNTAFNWRTGRIAEGPVHNPHYFAWLQQQGLQGQPGQQRQAPNPAGPPNCDQDMDRQITRVLAGTNNYHYGNRISRQSSRPITDEIWLAEAWRIVREIEDPYGRVREVSTDEEFRKLRVKYLADEVTEEDWKIALQRLEKDVNFQRAKRQVRDLFLGAARDTMRQLLAPEHNNADIKRQLEELIVYCNKSYDDISKRFGRKSSLIVVKPW
jgi:hypothetical protein